MYLKWYINISNACFHKLEWIYIAPRVIENERLLTWTNTLDKIDEYFFNIQEHINQLCSTMFST